MRKGIAGFVTLVVVLLVVDAGDTMRLIAWSVKTILFAIMGPAVTNDDQLRAILRTDQQNVDDRVSAIVGTITIVLVVSLILYIIRKASFRDSNDPAVQMNNDMGNATGFVAKQKSIGRIGFLVIVSVSIALEVLRRMGYTGRW